LTRAGASTRSRLRRAAAAILKAGLQAAAPEPLVRRELRNAREHLRVRGRLVLVAAGKAATSMARAAQDALGDRIHEAIVVDAEASARPTLQGARVFAAGHPLPDARGLEAASAILELAGGLEHDDLLLLLLSGGASALLPAPVAGVTLEDKAAVTSLLQRAGASIRELNCVRKHLSRLKGGGLARIVWPARTLALVLSDVVGDDLATIASGPAAPDPTRYADARAVLHTRGIWRAAPAGVRRHLEAGVRGERPETAKPGDPVFRRVETRIVGSARLSIEAAAREARRQGLRPLILTTRLEGEAREVARALVAILRECVETGRPVPPPVCLLAGGETTVTVTGRGRGGRNQELVTAAVEALDRFPIPAVVASLATDGIDGQSDAAGGVADDSSLARAGALGLAPPAAFLARSDTSGFLAPLGDLIVTGPSGTNVADLVALVAGQPGSGLYSPKRDS
jgi:hydroxypyruvate reductase